MMGLNVVDVIIEGGITKSRFGVGELMPVLIFNECDYSCEGKRGGRGFRVYCHKVDRKCKVGVSSAPKIPVSIKIDRGKFSSTIDDAINFYRAALAKYTAPTATKRQQKKAYTQSFIDTLHYLNETVPYKSQAGKSLIWDLVEQIQTLAIKDLLPSIREQYYLDLEQLLVKISQV